MIQPEYFSGFSNKRIITYPQSIMSNQQHCTFNLFRRNILQFTLRFRNPLNWNTNRNFFKLRWPKETAFSYYFLVSNQLTNCFLYGMANFWCYLFDSPGSS